MSSRDFAPGPRRAGANDARLLDVTHTATPLPIGPLTALLRGLVIATLAATLTPPPASAEPGHTFANEIACGRTSGFGAVACHQAFVTARVEFEAKTRSYPSRFACYHAYGPCMPWPAGAASLAHFRPQWMGVIVGGPAEARTALPVVAPGRVALALVPRALGDTVMAASAPSEPPERWATLPASAAVCRLIEAVARKQHLPPAFLARLLWQESSFRANVVSPAGALGIAQFMPGTAEERGLGDPFDPQRAIETSAGLLGELAQRFGNLGLAAAAYNGGPARVSGWLKGRRALAAETQAYVRRITGRPVEDWAAGTSAGAAPVPSPGPCNGPAQPGS